MDPTLQTALVGFLGAGTAVLGMVAREKRKASKNGNGNGYQAILAEIKHEVADRDGSVRAHGHDANNALQKVILRMERTGHHEEQTERLLEGIAQTLTQIRVDAAQRGNCCEHCS